MEHRWKERSEVSLDVVVRGRDELVVRGRSQDISPDGMFIRLAGRIPPTGTAVGIEVPQFGRLRGWVVHVGDEGIGVMFRTLDHKEKRLLRQLLAESVAAGRKCPPT